MICNALFVNLFFTFLKNYIAELYFWSPFIELEKKIQIIIQHWSKILQIKFGCIKDFDKLVANYVCFFYFVFHLNYNKNKQIYCYFLYRFCNIDYATFNNDTFICSGSYDNTVRVWDINSNNQILLEGYTDPIYYVKFSQYHYRNYHKNVICYAHHKNFIHFWDFKDNRQLQVFNKHEDIICGFELSAFNGGRYLCSGSFDKTIHLCDIETSKSLSVFNGHKNSVLCVDISPLQSNHKNDNKMNNIGVMVEMDIQFALDHWIIRFEYGILKKPNKLIYSKDINILLAV
ncbi:hypothetical protein RFI_35332 [Reticulomyxa filosa]|uniref:Uncharacterized protein n=1 Tax=Reticulomyxa filosa TaxID=46433 RepID=X6LN04_RETFI|nr:hypothetical protein RFI_35332 [Reticulomyxa filosa]|eukprot:ETO02105.1 hypothetical protein RFI_35332 [Reticulomyxa filosa]